MTWVHIVWQVRDSDMYKYLQNCHDKFIDVDPILKLQIICE